MRHLGNYHMYLRRLVFRAGIVYQHVQLFMKAYRNAHPCTLSREKTDTAMNSSCCKCCEPLLYFQQVSSRLLLEMVSRSVKAVVRNFLREDSPPSTTPSVAVAEASLQQLSSISFAPFEIGDLPATPSSHSAASGHAPTSIEPSSSSKVSTKSNYFLPFSLTPNDKGAAVAAPKTEINARSLDHERSSITTAKQFTAALTNELPESFCLVHFS